MAKTPAQRAAKHGIQATPVNPTRTAAGQSNRGKPAGSTGDPQKATGNAYLIVIAGVVASLFLFWYFHLLTLNQMTQLSGGLAMPDSRFGGFSTGDMETLRSAMDDNARGQLNYVHKTAGILFPLIFGLSWILLISQNVARGVLRLSLCAVPVLFAATQIWANTAIDGMLAGSPVDTGQVALASTLTVASWALLALSLVAAVVAIIARQRRAGATAGAPSNPVG